MPGLALASQPETHWTIVCQQRMDNARPSFNLAPVTPTADDQTRFRCHTNQMRVVVRPHRLNLLEQIVGIGGPIAERIAQEQAPVSPTPGESNQPPQCRVVVFLIGSRAI